MRTIKIAERQSAATWERPSVMFLYLQRLWCPTGDSLVVLFDNNLFLSLYEDISQNTPDDSASRKPDVKVFSQRNAWRTKLHGVLSRSPRLGVAATPSLQWLQSSMLMLAARNVLAHALSEGMFLSFIEGVVMHCGVTQCRRYMISSPSQTSYLDSFQISICKIRMFSKTCQVEASLLLYLKTSFVKALMNHEHFSLELQMRNNHQQIMPHWCLNYWDAVCGLASNSLNQEMSKGHLDVLTSVQQLSPVQSHMKGKMQLQVWGLCLKQFFAFPYPTAQRGDQGGNP